MHLTFLQGFPSGAMAKKKKKKKKKSICQCRRHKRQKFYFWVGKIPWRKASQLTPVFLPGKFYRKRSLASYRPWGHKESDMTEHTHMTFLHGLTVHFFLVLNNIPLSGCTTVYSSIHLLKDILTVSKFWQFELSCYKHCCTSFCVDISF